jgi:hypothetical protein
MTNIKIPFVQIIAKMLRFLENLIGSFLSTAFVGNAFHSVKHLVSYARDARRYARSSFRMSAIGT